MTIAVVLTALMVIILWNFLLTQLTSYTNLEAQSTESASLASLMDRTSRVVRGTTGVVIAQNTTLTVYAYFSPADQVVDKVRYFIAASSLEVGVISPTGNPPNYTYDPANEKVTVLTNNLKLGNQALFSYYDDAGNQLAAGFSIAQVHQIGVFLAVNQNPHNQSQPFGLSTIVTLRNLKTNL